MGGDPIKSVLPLNSQPDLAESPSADQHSKVFSEAIADLQPAASQAKANPAPQQTHDPAPTRNLPDHTGVRFEHPGTATKRAADAPDAPPNRTKPNRPAPHVSEQYWMDNDQASAGDNEPFYRPRTFH